MSDSRSGRRRRRLRLALAAVAGVVRRGRLPARGAADVHLPAQAGGEEPVRPARRGQRGDHRSRRLGHELAARVRRLQAHRRGHADAFGGSEALPAEKASRDPWLTRMFAGYAFAIDYRDRRGHAYMLPDQEQTKRVTERPQPGACLHCHASVIPTYRRLGRRRRLQGLRGARQADLRRRARRGRQDRLRRTRSPAAPTTRFQHVDGAHPVTCVDCHDPKSMELRVTRPGFIRGIQALAAGAEPDAAPREHRALAARRPRASPTIPTSTPPARRCGRSSAASATSSTTAARRRRCSTPGTTA